MAISDKGKGMRKKKEGLIQKICHLIKDIVNRLTLLAVVHYIWKFALLGIKLLYWLIEVGCLILKAVATWMNHGHGKHENVVVHYEDAKHSHHHPDVHYADGDEHYEEPDHDYKPWDRYYAQDLAYAKQKPPQSFLGSLFS